MSRTSLITPRVTLLAQNMESKAMTLDLQLWMMIPIATTLTVKVNIMLKAKTKLIV